MKNIKLFVFNLLILTIFFSSCDDYVDLTPKGLVIPESMEDLENILADDYKILLAAHLNNYLMDDDGYLPSSQFSAFQASYNPESSKRSYQLMDYFYLDTENDMDWDNNYNLIGISNYVLGRLDLVSDSQNKKEEVKGQALVHRAFSYLNLINLYARHYAAGDPNDPESGVLLITEFGNPEVPVKRASIQEVYDFIIADLNESVTLLKEDFSPLKYKPTKVVAYSLLARAYLHMEEYELAISNANAALSIQSTLTNYPTRLPELGNTLGHGRAYPNNPSEENLTEIIMSKSSSGPFYVSFFPVFNIFSFTYVRQEVVDLYNQDHDTRFTYLINFDDSAGAYRWTGGDKSPPLTRCDLTVAEVLLIRAESNARLGNLNESIADLNKLRAKRFDTDDPAIVNLTATTSEEALQHTLEERRRELLYRGTRFFDIKRLNAVDNAGIDIERTDFQGNPISLPAGDLRWAIAIPPKEIALRPEIKQNPR